MSTTPDIITPRDSTTMGVFADAAGSQTPAQIATGAGSGVHLWSGGTSKPNAQRDITSETDLAAVIAERDALRVAFADASQQCSNNGRKQYLEEGWLDPLNRKAVEAERDAAIAVAKELKELLFLLARAIHGEDWNEIGNLVPRMSAAFKI